jgi:transcriptional regulator with XRE-family HTH domain
MREVARRSGFDVSLLSNIAKGKRVSGPELWTLVALADAMDLDLDLSFSRR